MENQKNLETGFLDARSGSQTLRHQDIGELFLINFIHALAAARKPSKETNTQEKYQQLEASLLKPNLQEKNVIKMVPQFLRPIQIKKQFTPQTTNIPLNNIQPKFNNYLTEKRIPDQNNQSNIKSGTESLNSLIRNPSINEIECIGADNPLMVKIRGMTQKTQVKLTIEEIYDLIAEFSQKTKIPIINGSIKAALNNLIITAVLSETLGPRFILQKKRLSQQLI